MVKKLIIVMLGVLLVIGIAQSQQTFDITTSLVSSATDLPAFGTRGAKKVTIFYVMSDSTDTLWTRVTGAAGRADTFINLDSNGNITKFALAQYQSEWAFSIVIEHVPPFMKVEIDSLAYSDTDTWDMSAGTRYSDDVMVIRTVLEY